MGKIRKNREKTKAEKHAHSAVYGAVCVIALILAISVFLNRDWLGSIAAIFEKMNIEPGVRISFSYDERSKATVYDGGICVYTGGDLNFFNYHGELQKSVNTDFADPVVKSAGEYVFVYENGANELFVYKKGECKFNHTFGNSILGLYVSDGGDFAVCTGSSQSVCALYVFNSAFSELYQYYSASGNIIDVSLDLPNKEFYMLSLDFDISVFAKLTVHNIYEESVQKTFTFQGEIPYHVCGNNGEIMLMTDKGLYFVKASDNTHSQKTEIDGAYSFKAFDGKISILSKNQDGSDTVSIYMVGNGAVFSKIFAEDITDYTFDGENIYVLSRSGVEIYDYLGNLKNHCETDEGSYSIIPVASGIILVLTHSSAQLVGAE